MEFRLLGAVEVTDDGRVVPLGGPRQRALLALLLTSANRIVSTDRLVDELWGATPPKSALNTVQYYVSQLRKTLGADRIVTQPPGYLIRTRPGELDLEHFEQLLAQGDAGALEQALALWRGPALADLAYEPFARTEAARLEELRLLAIERRVDLDLERGGTAELVAELEALVAEHPLRERLRARLMLALYRSGRQAEALEAYRTTRAVLNDELGIVPGPELQQLEQAILRQDPSLLAPAADSPSVAERSIVVAPGESDGLEPLLSVAAPLARSVPARGLILVRLVGAAALGEASRVVFRRTEELSSTGITVRTAVFTSAEPGPELVRLAGEQAADLVLLDAPAGFLADGRLDGPVGAVLGLATCDVGILLAHAGEPRPAQPVLVPFGGAEHDWTAVELAAWIARTSGSTLRLLGRAADLAGGKRDASRLLARASLLVQRVVRVPTEPVLVAPGPEGILEAAVDASLLVLGLSDRWRQEGLGETRLAIAADAPCPLLLVRKGLKPGGIAPDATMTRFTWSLGFGRGTEPR